MFCLFSASMLDIVLVFFVSLYGAHRDLHGQTHAFPTRRAAYLFRVIGASNFNAMRLKAALDLARDAGLPHYHGLQPEYNLVSRTKFEGELQDLCVEHNIAVTPYYGLASGFLTGKYRTRADLDKSVRGNQIGRAPV